MGKMRCRCGHEMRLTGVDSPYEFSLIPEYVIEKISEKIEDKKDFSSAEFLDDIDREAVIVYRCTKCRRLYLEDNPDKPGNFYLYEKPDA